MAKKPLTTTELIQAITDRICENSDIHDIKKHKKTVYKILSAAQSGINAEDDVVFTKFNAIKTAFEAINCSYNHDHWDEIYALVCDDISVVWTGKRYLDEWEVILNNLTYIMH